jgi:hypothetical protein
MIKGEFTHMQERTEVARKVVGKPLTLKRFYYEYL